MVLCNLRAADSFVSVHLVKVNNAAMYFSSDLSYILKQKNLFHLFLCVCVGCDV